MPKVSLTEFTDFIIKSGTPKLTCVQKIKDSHDDGYLPSRDYWKKLRDGIVAFHENGGQDRSALDKITKAVRDRNKQANYPRAIKAYKKFLGKKTIKWFSPFKQIWNHRTLTVRVNPELGLNINGTPTVIKLYFKKEQIGQRQADLILHLLQHTAKHHNPSCKVGILDVQQSRLIHAKDFNERLTPLLKGEALSFTEIYNSL